MLSVVDKVPTAVAADYGFCCILASVTTGYWMGILAVACIVSTHGMLLI